MRASEPAILMACWPACCCAGPCCPLLPAAAGGSGGADAGGGGGDNMWKGLARKLERWEVGDAVMGDTSAAADGCGCGWWEPGGGSGETGDMPSGFAWGRRGFCVDVGLDDGVRLRVLTVRWLTGFRERPPCWLGVMLWLLLLAAAEPFCPLAPPTSSACSAMVVGSAWAVVVVAAPPPATTAAAADFSILWYGPVGLGPWLSSSSSSSAARLLKGARIRCMKGFLRSLYASKPSSARRASRATVCGTVSDLTRKKSSCG